MGAAGSGNIRQFRKGYQASSQESTTIIGIAIGIGIEVLTSKFHSVSIAIPIAIPMKQKRLRNCQTQPTETQVHNLKGLACLFPFPSTNPWRLACLNSTPLDNLDSPDARKRARNGR